MEKKTLTRDQARQVLAKQLVQYRTLPIDSPAFAEDGTFRCAISSETRVLRQTWLGDYQEILDHSAGAVRLDRMRGGMALLFNHDVDAHLGLIGDPEIGADRCLRGLAKFATNSLAQEKKTDVQGGTLKWTSVGYLVHDLQEEGEDENGIPIFRAVDWEPVETSLVTVPADYSVGVGRSQFQKDSAGVIAGENLAASAAHLEVIMGDISAVPAAPAVETIAAVRAQAGAEAREEATRARAIRALAEAHRMQDRAEDWITSGKSFDAVQTEIRALLVERNKQIVSAPPMSQVIPSEESKKFSLVRAIRSIAGRAMGFDDDGGFEQEVSRTMAATLEKSGIKTHGGLLIPTNLPLSSRDVKRYQKRTAGDLQNASTLGAELVFTEPMTFIELLRNALVVSKMGSTFFSDLVGPVKFPSQTAAGTLSWTTEASGSDVSDSFLAFGSVTLSPKSAQSSTGYTRQLLAQASFDVEAIVRADLVAINALGIDYAALCGPGTGGSPKGITATSGIGSVAIGTNGGPPTWASIINLQTALFKQNVLPVNPGYVTSPGVRGYCMQTPIVSNFPRMIWTDVNELAGYPAMVSNQIPQALTKGSSNNCHAAIFGNWRDLLIGEWGVLEIIVDPYRLKKQGIIEVTSFVMVDVALRYAVSFAADLDLIPTY